MHTGTLPRDWVTVIMLYPYLKVETRILPTAYRPISLTSVIMKTVERIIHSKLTGV